MEKDIGIPHNFYGISEHKAKESEKHGTYGGTYKYVYAPKNNNFDLWTYENNFTWQIHITAYVDEINKNVRGFHVTFEQQVEGEQKIFRFEAAKDSEDIKDEFLSKQNPNKKEFKVKGGTKNDILPKSEIRKDKLLEEDYNQCKEISKVVSKKFFEAVKDVDNKFQGGLNAILKEFGIKNAHISQAEKTTMYVQQSKNFATLIQNAAGPEKKESSKETDLTKGLNLDTEKFSTNEDKQKFKENLKQRSSSNVSSRHSMLRQVRKNVFTEAEDSKNKQQSISDVNLTLQDDLYADLPPLSNQSEKNQSPRSANPVSKASQETTTPGFSNEKRKAENIAKSPKNEPPKKPAANEKNYIDTSYNSPSLFKKS